MPRKARKDSESCFYHIVVKGMNKEFIFEKEEYIIKYKEIIKEKLEESQITILAYCIMNNHAHFLIYSEKCQELSKYMQKLNTSYSNFYNKINNRVGYVFRDRYYSQDILNYKQLYNCLNYIHNNPVKAHMVKKLEEYDHSSYNEFLNNREIITEKSIKLLFGSSEKFEKEFHMIHLSYIENEEEFLEIKELDISDFILIFQRQYEMKIEEIINNKEILRKLILEARKETDVTIVELAKTLNLSKSTIWNYEKMEKRTVPFSKRID